MSGASGYFAPDNPRTILILRNGQELQIDPNRLLRGNDILLQPGDIIELQQ